jgi:hypothetical protein
MDTKQAILNCPREVKIEVLRDAMRSGDIGMFISLSKVLLDAPINEGGIETEVIEAIRNEFT